jgi:phospholipid transport system substrate-binding protein
MTDRGHRPLNRRELGGLLLAAMFGMPAPALANTPAEDYVTGIAENVMALANTGQKGPALRAKFAALMNRYINLKSIADFALGPYSKKLPAAKRAEFYDLVSNYAAALFVYYVDDFRGTELEIVSTTKHG